MNDIKEINWEEFLNQADVVEVDPDSLEPSGYNPRSIQDDEFRKLMQDIKADPEFMRQRPILVNDVNGVMMIYAGHQRWKACKTLEWKTVPVSIDTDLDEATLKSRMVMDNIHYGQWDDVKFSEFNETSLEHMNILEVKDFGGDDGTDYRKDFSNISNRKKDDVENEQNSETGKHIFSLIFDTEDQREEFQVLASNLAGDERFEDYLVRSMKEMYGEK